MIAPMPRKRRRVNGGDVRRTPRRVTSSLREFTDHIKPDQTIEVRVARVMRQSPNSSKYIRLDTDFQGVEDGLDYPVYTGLSSTIVGATGGPAANSEVLIWRVGKGGWHVRDTRNY